MILEWLQPDPSWLDAATVLLRALYHAAALGAAGLFLYALLDDDPRVRRWIVAAALLGIAFSLLALPLRVLMLTAGTSAWDAGIWGAVLGSRIGDAFWLRAGGLLGLLLAALVPGRAALALGGAAVLMVAGSYAAMGHSTLYRPRQELSVLVTLHLLAVAFWTGSLLPLAAAARRGDGVLVARW
ncbi:MAG: copper resistance protein, partial [Acetobacteraceae bacterium]|nr:copper resistance protein [Acetobacteraceae bacterium]